MYIAYTEKSKAVEVTHEKDFWDDDKDDDTEEQLEYMGSNIKHSW